MKQALIVLLILITLNPAAANDWKTGATGLYLVVPPRPLGTRGLQNGMVVLHRPPEGGRRAPLRLPVHLLPRRRAANGAGHGFRLDGPRT